MIQLPPPLQALAEYPQFIIVKLVPKSNGKTDKIPTSPHTYDVGINPHDPQQWVSADMACTAATLGGSEYRVGFVLTSNDPFWFLDIDNCLERDGWSPLANELLTLLQGSAVEISQSKSSLHVIGSGVCPEHGCKNVKKDLELYTTGRVITLTGEGALGDVAFDTSSVLPQLVSTYFPPKASISTNSEWTDYPCDEWIGPEDDDVLISKMLGSKSTRAKVGFAASFEDLWTANDNLNIHYPHETNGFDRSSADAALAQHLAFWTGKNCARIQRLMLRSALVREKWQREKYITDTIINAVSNQTDVYKATNQQVNNISENTEMLAGLQFLSPDQQIKMFENCAYIRHHHKIWVPDGGMLSPETFKAMYGGYVYALDAIADKTTRNAYEAFTQSQAVRFPKVSNICFRPELPTGAIIEEEGLKILNSYVPIETEMTNEPVDPFLNHVRLLIPDPLDQKIILTYMASLIQNPGVKFQWCPLIQGAEGNGKTLLARVLEHCVGKRYTHFPKAEDLGGNGLKFNAWMMNKLFIGVEDIYVSDRHEITEALKPAITNERLEFQAKGTDQYTSDNRANWLMFSNHKDAIRVTVDTRRYCIIYSAQQSKEDKLRDGMGGDYFPRLYNWLREGGYAAVNGYFRRFHCDPAYDPATRCVEAPRTTSTAAAVNASLGKVEQAVIEAIESGAIGFRGGWISSKKFDDLLQSIGADRYLPINKRRDVLLKLDYDWHPNLSNGRVNNDMPIEGGKPKLFVHRNSQLLDIQEPWAVAKEYMKAQGYIVS